ncbi:hypothetical protein cyc_01982 [Cyclospora cayetanensis]|uniref:Uncharacterized protein n=1 Tax=Cyclospora cayetanensis TaxID=88456 RepID=A0A1D3CZK5_9EIME|nr:hypothetical protein cyc_01982 [Cyclospora cayetanensis]
MLVHKHRVELLLTQVVEKVEEPVADDDLGWGLEPQQESQWVAPGTSPASTGGEGPLARSLRVSAVGAYELESKRDKSWGTMKKLEEEQRRGLQELREQEQRELLLLQQQPQKGQTQEASDKQDADGDSPQVKDNIRDEVEADNLPVSARVLRALGSGSFQRKARGTFVPSFEDDPDLATAAQMVSTKQQPQGKKQQAGRKSPVDVSHESSGSASSSSKSEDHHQQQQDQGLLSTSDSEGSVAGPAAVIFDVQKFVSFEGLSVAGVVLDAELVRRKYETRPPWTTLTAAKV